MSKKWFKFLKRWSEWRKICRKFDSKLTMLFDNVMSQAYEHLETEEDLMTKQNDIAVICGTYQRARFEFTRFCDYFKQHLKSANIHQLTIIMTDGQKIIFVVDQRHLKGMQCDVCGIDVFVSEYYHEQHVKEVNDD